MSQLEWKRLSPDHLVAGDYTVTRDQDFEKPEFVYFAAHKKELLTVCYSAEVAKTACELHSKAIPEVDLTKTADQR